MNRHQPELKPPATILMTLDHQGLFHELETNKQELVGYIRYGLQNWDIQLEAMVKQSEESIKIPLTNQEKLEELSKINPALFILKEKLKLDLN